MNRIRMAVVGVGHLGKEHARVLGSFRDVDLVGVADVNEPRRSRRCAGDAERERLNATRICSILSTPFRSPLRRFITTSIARSFLERGIPVLVEKPITTTLAQADELVEIANAQGIPFQIGHIERFNPAFEELATPSAEPEID